MKQVNSAEVLGEAFKTYGRHASVVVGTSIFIQVLGAMASFVILGKTGEAGFGLVGAVALVTSQLTLGVCTLLLLQIRAGSDVPTITTLITAALPRLLLLLWLAIIMSVAIGLASIFFVLPGLYLSLRWSVASPAMIAGKLSATDSLRSSAALTSGNFLSVFVIVLFQSAVSIVAPFIAMRMANLNIENYVMGLAVVMAIVGPLPALALAEMFLRLAGYSPDGVVEVATPAGPAHRVHVPLGHAPSGGMPAVAAAASTQDWAPAAGAPGGTYPPQASTHAASHAYTPQGYIPGQPAHAAPQTYAPVHHEPAHAAPMQPVPPLAASAPAQPHLGAAQAPAYGAPMQQPHQGPAVGAGAYAHQHPASQAQQIHQARHAGEQPYQAHPHGAEPRHHPQHAPVAAPAPNPYGQPMPGPHAPAGPVDRSASVPPPGFS